MSDDLDTSIRPQKWQRRGFQPEYIPPPPNPLIRINNLVREIREEKNPVRKAELEAQFKRECDEFDAINPEAKTVDIHALYSEIVSVVVPTGEAISIPERIGKEEWEAIHKSILAAKASASAWASKSRRYATERWGAAYVNATEEQLELALGIQRIEQQPTEPTTEATLTRIASIANRLSPILGGNLDTWNEQQRQQALNAIMPIVELAKRLGAA